MALIEYHELQSVYEALLQASNEFQLMDGFEDLNDFFLDRDTLEKLYYATELVKGIMKQSGEGYEDITLGH